jgi:hypothetical protein
MKQDWGKALIKLPAESALLSGPPQGLRFRSSPRLVRFGLLIHSEIPLLNAVSPKIVIWHWTRFVRPVGQGPFSERRHGFQFAIPILK